MKPVKVTPFKLDGKPLDLSRMPPLARKIKQFLDGLPADELLRGHALATAVGSTLGSVLSASLRSQQLAPYCTSLARPVRQKVFGNPAAIAALKRELGVE